MAATTGGTAFGRSPDVEQSAALHPGDGHAATASASAGASPLQRLTRQRRWTVILAAALLALFVFALLGTASRDKDGLSLQTAASRLGSYAHFNKGSGGTYPGRPASGTAFSDGNSTDNLWLKNSGRKGLRYKTAFNPDDLTMTEDECDTFFPKLYKEIDRSVEYFSTKQVFDKEYLEYSCDDGIWTHARVVIYNNRVYLKSYQNSEPTRTKAALSLLQLAVVASRQRLPNVEFCIGLMEWGSRGKFGLDRAPDLEDVWLMPDYGFWSWPEHVGSYQELRERAAKVEEEVGWFGKTDKLLWRGSTKAGTTDREALVASAQGHDWSDVSYIDWFLPYKRPVAMEDYCRWKFLAFPEGNANNGRLRYLQNCKSVLITHQPRWVQHWTHLYNADWNSKDQNVVFVDPPPLHDNDPEKGVVVHDSKGRVIGRDRTWEMLPQAMERLLWRDRVARKIAENQWDFFRQRYATPASAMCYWRKAIKGFAKVQKYDVDLSGSETSFESFMLMGIRGWHH